MVYAGFAMLTALIIGVTVWFEALLYRHPGQEVACRDGPPNLLIGEAHPASLELYWFPFGFRCVWPTTDGGTVSATPEWTATVQLGIALTLAVSAYISGAFAIRALKRADAIV